MWKLSTWTYILNGIGMLFHHSVAMYYITAFNFGLYYPTKHAIITPIPVCLQHATHVLKYVAPSAYPIVQLGLEIWFEFEIFAVLKGAITQTTQPYVCFTMLTAHWMFWMAALISMFVPEEKHVTRASVLSVPEVINAFSSQLFIPEEHMSRIPKKRKLESTQSKSSHVIIIENKAALRASALRNHRPVKHVMPQSSDGVLHNKFLKDEKQRLHDEGTSLTRFRKWSQPGEEESTSTNAPALKIPVHAMPSKDLAVE